MNNVKVTVCISVHNTADLLPRCLDSVCAQTLESLEIVLVNNGSTDNSEDIMRQYATSHHERKFVILAQEDRGLAQGRQTGINHANGEYLTFLDADDYIEKNAYEKMLLCAEQNDVDIVEIETIREGKILSSPYTGKQDAHAILKAYFTKKNLQTMLWLRLYKRTLFDKPVMPTLYTNNEDSFAIPCLLYKARTIYFLKEPLHTYSTDNEQGVMHMLTTNPQLSEKRFKNRQTALNSLTHFQDYVGAEGMQLFQKEFDIYKASVLCSFLFTNFQGKSQVEKENAISEVINFPSAKVLHMFIKRWVPTTSNMYKTVKVLGVNVTYKLYKYFKKL